MGTHGERKGDAERHDYGGGRSEASGYVLARQMGGSQCSTNKGPNYGADTAAANPRAAASGSGDALPLGNKIEPRRPSHTQRPADAFKFGSLRSAR